MATARAKFPGGIIAEFASPARRGRRNKIAIICSGAPGSPSKEQTTEFFSRNGFWVFAMRYRGTWESEGKFLKESLEEDVKLVLNGISRGFRDLWTGERHKLALDEVFIFGSSFGGPAAFFMSKDPRVSKVVAISPVVDWRIHEKSGPLERERRFIEDGYGPAYRMDLRNWKRMSAGKFYNPATAMDRIDGSKVLIVHTKDDRTVSWRPVAKFAKETGSRIILVAKGGHGSRILTPALKRRILRFLSD